MASIEPAAGSSSELSAEDHKPCHTCQVRFANSEVLLQHFGSQWHQYNVKRAASQLPPVTLTGFERKLAAAIQQREESALASRPRKFKCLVTGKVFNSIGQLQTHYAAKKTKSAISKQLKAGKLTEDPLKDFDFSALSNSHIPQCVKVIFLDGAEPPQPVIDSEHAKHMHDISQYSTVHDICFLDLQPVKDFEENLQRLVEVHGLVIPDIPFLSDLTGLIEYCHDKVTKGYSCLYCDAGFSSLPGVLQHMKDAGHVKFPFDVHAGDPMAEYEAFYDFDKEVTVKNSKGEDIVIMSRADREYDEYGNMILPDGSSLGNKAYALYFQQSLHTPRESTALAAAKSEGTKRVLRHYLGNEQAQALVAHTSRGPGAAQALSTHRDAVLFKAKTKATKVAEHARTIADRRAVKEAVHVDTDKVKAKKRYFVQQYMGAG